MPDMEATTPPFDQSSANGGAVRTSQQALAAADAEIKELCAEFGALTYTYERENARAKETLGALAAERARVKQALDAASQRRAALAAAAAATPTAPPAPSATATTPQAPSATATDAPTPQA